VKAYRVRCRRFRHTIGQRPVMVGDITTEHVAASSRSAVRSAGCPRSAVFVGQGVWSTQPAAGSVPWGKTVCYCRWSVAVNFRACPGWGKGPRGSLAE
jgi:hypothetical protein